MDSVELRVTGGPFVTAEDSPLSELLSLFCLVWFILFGLDLDSHSHYMFIKCSFQLADWCLLMRRKSAENEVPGSGGDGGLSTPRGGSEGPTAGLAVGGVANATTHRRKPFMEALYKAVELAAPEALDWTHEIVNLDVAPRSKSLSKEKNNHPPSPVDPDSEAVSLVDIPCFRNAWTITLCPQKTLV